MLNSKKTVLKHHQNQTLENQRFKKFKKAAREK